MQLLRRGRRSERAERGQVLVIFTLSAVAIIAMVGLVIDGGWTFVQRRDQQNVADSAAMAAGYAYLNSTPRYDAATAVAAAKANAAANGYTDSVGGVSVGVTVNSSDIVVSVTKPHQNFFSGIMGFSQWNVSTTATTESGVPNTAVGAMPIIFNQHVIDGTPGHGYGPGNERPFSEPANGGNDLPSGTDEFNWTIFCTGNGDGNGGSGSGNDGCNASTNQVDSLVTGANSNPQTVNTGMEIGPLNAGSHTALFSDFAEFVGTSFPVAIVDDNGNFLGLASFHITGSSGGSTKQIRGYFEGPISTKSFKIEPGVPGGLSNSYGTWAVTLTN